MNREDEPVRNETRGIRPDQHEDDSVQEIIFLLQWEWPEHIETALRRILWTRFVELAEDPDQSEHIKQNDFIRWLIAIHPESPTEVLDYISNNARATLSERIAENSQTSSSTLMRLIGHQSTQVRIAAAENANCPISALYTLIKDPDVDVRYALAENARLPQKILQALSLDENGYVAARAAKTLARLREPIVFQLNIPESKQAKRQQLG